MGAAEDRIVLRCIVYPGENEGQRGYFAQCIDLDLLVWRPREDAAMEALEEQIKGYLNAATDLGKFASLVPRPAPFFPDRLQYHAVALAKAIPRLWRRFPYSLYERPIPPDMISQAAMP